MQFYSNNLTKIFFVSSLCINLAVTAMIQSAVRAEHSYSFACNSIKNSKKIVPTTVILFSNRSSAPLIRWESEFIINPQQQCVEVSKKFDDFSKRGSLHFLKFTTNKKTGKTTICGLSKQQQDRSCDRSNQLFELSKAMKDPKQVLIGLRNSLVKIDSDNSILQNADDEYTQIIDLSSSIDRLVDRQRQSLGF
jgi:Circadian oscillating protein COP23